MACESHVVVLVILKHKLSAYHPRVAWFFVRHMAKWLSDWLVELVCGYGERPWRTVAMMAIVFAVFVGTLMYSIV